VTQVIANGNTYSDDGTAAKDMQNGGHRTHLLPMLSDVLVDAADAATDAAAASASAITAANAASASATTAANAAAALYGTSSTSVTIGTGSKGPFTTQASKQFAVGVFLLIYSTANPANYMYGQVTAYSGTSLTVDVAAIGGSGTLTDWKIAVAGIRGATGSAGPATQVNSAKIGNYTLVAGDQGNLIDCTGTFNLTFTAAATLGSGWWCEVKNSGTGVITLVRSGSDTIDGLTTYAIYPGEQRRFLYSTSSTFVSKVIHPFHHTFTASGSWIEPPGYKAFEGLLWGAGGGGGNMGGAFTAGGGGGGACVPIYRVPAGAGTSVTVTIATITSRATAAASGPTGGTSSFGSINAYGGGGGNGNGSSNATGGGGGGAFGAGSVGNIGSSGGAGGGSGQGATSVSDGFSGSGGSNDSIFGGAGGGGNTTDNFGGDSVFGGAGGGRGAATNTTGGTSQAGGAGGAGSDSGNGTDGTAPGGGGGGTRTGTNAGAGARGELRIWGIA